MNNDQVMAMEPLRRDYSLFHVSVSSSAYVQYIHLENSWIAAKQAVVIST